MTTNNTAAVAAKAGAAAGQAKDAALNAVGAVRSKIAATGAPSLESALYTILGTMLYGSPASNGLPRDTFWRIDDRLMPQPGESTHKETQKRIYTNLVRVEMTRIERRIAIGLGIGMLVLLFFAGSTVAPVLQNLL